ncbi:divalent-cation tolerance protein CutA [Roseomonas populi]|uniref:Divalent-cation tolerance protein CutA n=1 Tax=Roseomonas populi TaxID=3121582 RepID=A0ABT1XBG4_9PROT|nr:divalent-cation tolerance protein CutA [Roseomonas pecuniae]MCR0985476.1 divalent-cation tolerance protein CutA [Roseomonas pecuniae]
MDDPELPLFVYVTAADAAEARRIGRALVDERLAACVNILPGHASIYRWEGAIEEAEEGAFIAKTTRSRFEALRARVRALHSYTTPCIVALPISEGDADYLSWLKGEVS